MTSNDLVVVLPGITGSTLGVRGADGSPASENLIWRTRSKDGVHWGDPVEVARRPNHQLVSPAVVRRGRWG